MVVPKYSATLQVTRRKVVDDSQVFPARLAVMVKIRNLSYTHCPITVSGTKSFIVAGGGVKHTSIVPNG
jgi:hypothetical protein